MVYGKGKICDDFLNDDLKYNKDDYYVHKNVHNFEEDKKVNAAIKIVNENADINAEPGPSKQIKQKKAPLSRYDLFLDKTKKAINMILLRVISYPFSLVHLKIVIYI